MTPWAAAHLPGAKLFPANPLSTLYVASNFSIAIIIIDCGLWMDKWSEGGKLVPKKISQGKRGSQLVSLENPSRSGEHYPSFQVERRDQ